MEKYTKAQMEVIEFENEDVITTSGCNGVNARVFFAASMLFVWMSSHRCSKSSA